MIKYIIDIIISYIEYSIYIITLLLLITIIIIIRGRGVKGGEGSFCLPLYLII